MTAAIARDAPAHDTQTLLLRVATDPARRERFYELLGTFCHQCRNHLNTLSLSFYLAGRTGLADDWALWDEQQGRYRTVEQLYDRLQQICRPMSMTPVRLPIALLWDELFPAWTEQLGCRGIVFEAVPPPSPVVGDFDPTRLRPALEAFAEWRTRAARQPGAVTFSWREEDDHCHLEWTEFAALEANAPEPSSAEGADALALPFLARVLSEHGGSLEVEPRHGFEVHMRWPLVIAGLERG